MSETTVTGGSVTYMQVICPWCAGTHSGICSLVEEQEFYPDGKLKRVKFSERPDPGPTITITGNGHICGVDCPEIT